MNRSLRMVLVTSILLNLLLAGMWIGCVGKGFLEGGKNDPQTVVAGLPNDTRILFNDMLVKTRMDLAPLRAEIDGTRRAALCLLHRETFDREAYLATTERLHTLYGHLTKRMSIAVADASAKLPSQARIAFVDMLKPTPPVRDLTTDCSETTEH
jgi:uncharacterized membrane protein